MAMMKKQSIRKRARKVGRYRIGKKGFIRAVFGAGLTLAGSIAHAVTPATVAIYLYDSNGNAANVTSQYVYAYQDPHVYDLYGNSIGTVDSANFIDDNTGAHIGYVSGTGPQ